jgi:hypothetical protein
MDLSRTVACTALVLIVLLSAGHAFSQDKPPAVDEAAMKRQEAQEARLHAAEERRLRQKRLDEEISRLCVIKAVMTDAEIDGCRIAYRMY